MQFPAFIDNRDENRQFDRVINHIIFPYIREMRIAVGYFYLSGFELVMDSLENNEFFQKNDVQIKFLISPRTDYTTAKVLETAFKIPKTDSELKREIIQNIETEVSGLEKEKLLKIIELLENDKIHIRLMLNRFFHAKLYLARTVLPGNIEQVRTIVGSSNFSKSGLTENSELNLTSSDIPVYNELKIWFDELWESEGIDFRPELLQIVKGILREKQHTQKREDIFLTPFQMLVYMVYYFIGKMEEEELQGTDQLAEFQRIGAENILNKIERFGGAIVSDSVGLGKTFTASEVIYRYYKRGKKVLILTPPTVLHQWKETLSKYFSIDASSDLVFLSQGKLSQMLPSAIESKLRKKKFDLIVVDEAHRARNKDTRLYQHISLLHPYSSRSDVLLLTATPFNNSVSDLLNLVKLSTVEASLTNAGLYPSSFQVFSELIKNLRKGISIRELENNPDYERAKKRIIDILNSVMLLRMRSSIKEKYKNVKVGGKPLEFQEPTVYKIEYEFTGGFEAIFENINSFLDSLFLPHIRLSGNSNGETLSYLYKLLLFKRIESSVYSFYCSLENIKAKITTLRSEIDSEDWNEVIEKYNQKKLEEEPELEDYSEDIKDGKEDLIDKETVIKWCETDIKTINDFIESYIIPLREKPDEPLSLKEPKIEIFLDRLNRSHFIKALCFCSYKDTLEYIKYHIQQACEDNKIDLLFDTVSGDDRTSGRISKVLDKFAPRARKVENITESEELNLLISTDVLAEGVNLQDADLLINFDLPWNPMKIVQRVGRINRIGSENKIKVFNFTPDKILERFLKLLEILSAKISQVNTLLGKEMAILSSDEEEINPQIIGEQLKKNYNANSVSEYEINSKSNSLFSGIEGETEEDFFRAKLFVAAKENHLRSSDFKGVPKKKAEYYTITNKNPNTIYKLYEIYGERNQNRDLLSRVFLCKKGNENVEYAFPEEFFEKANLQSEGFTRVEVENKEWVEKAEEEINLAFKEIFIERLKEADPHKVSQKVSSVKGIQVQLIQTLQGLKKQKALFVEENFFEFAKTIREDAEIVFKEMMQILGTTQLSSDKANKLKDTLNKYNINIKQVPKVAFNDFASALFTFYNEVILEDSSMRGSLYKSSEIHSQLVLSIYI